MTYAPWTANTIAEQIRGEMNMDENAAVDPPIPSRLLKLIYEAGAGLWMMSDWPFRLKQGTLTTVASNEDASTPSDFSKLDQVWLNKQEDYAPIRFHSDPRGFQMASDRDIDADEGSPTDALVVPDASGGYTFQLTPVPDAVYTYKFWFFIEDPWTGGAIADDGAPGWPAPFPELWHLYSTARAQRHFRADDSWQEAWAHFKQRLNDAKNDNNEVITEPNDLIIDGYGDFSRRNAPFLTSGPWSF